MSADVEIFGLLESKFLTPINHFIDTSSQSVAEYVAGPLAVAITIYVVGIGIMFMRGTHEISVMEFVLMCVKAAIIFTLATKSSEYIIYVSNLFFDTLPREIGQAINNGKELQTSSIDSLLRKGVDAGLEIWENAPNSPSLIIYAVVIALIWLMALFCCTVVFIVSLYAKVALALVIALGPIFIGLALFKSTRRFTEYWIGQAVNFVILQVLVLALGALLISTAESLTLNVSDLLDLIIAVLNFSAVAIVSVYIFFQLPSIASALAGGGASLGLGMSIHRESGALAAYRAFRGNQGSPNQNQRGRSDHATPNSSPTQTGGSPGGSGGGGSGLAAPPPDRPPAPTTPRPGQI